ncbi:DUF3085 domain-containing protein [Mesorhizobium sp.]|uniref:DUF3085 domain-containing protein n=1 Tax=Mesorhizobium sp. TaxID=1871066 RepID=UPI000FE4C767|nr:DUF3085 domain-containing protein [Mesorhizobium sp.]RWI16523.1 MAG: DUF3085 domain-containing protein [Mesorhizobium sp.]RWN06249.1 MAG: DUF3085 domain-containing protein [Mesorhizobium sp.]RWN08212.1 MAG: DUF3085 domain-containing protein [Mesorhizobium sp.]TIQ97641.1 MAG: DUF3085 domain-containing protein [Mesorhizobium sp.]
MFTFPIPAVRKVVERGIADAAANGGFRNPYYGTRPGEGERPGLWLVGDKGVYIMSNGKLAEGSRALVVYSEQCHPNSDIDLWDYKRRHFGGDDGIEFIEAERVIPLFDRNMRATHLNVELTDTEIGLSLITR